ncbi:beta-ketoacyl synthase N-terminal-like domain-containing protein [Dactylosporangium sp. CA-233914]|uniref:beta-ketoacyl synthase N-terminal-like domain-containing protein n=1 Tax=Dactylosporangium sp. CA-233914 TaxID=3239934 RepID=UPI003D918063
MSTGAVAVTGMAWTTGLGAGLEPVWQALTAGRSALRRVPSALALRSDLAAVIAEVPLDAAPALRQRVLAVTTMLRCLADADLGADDPRIRPVLGTSFGADLDDPPAGSLSAWAVDAASRAGLVQRPVVVTTACSSGSDAVLIARSLIRCGAAELCLCGGVDVLTAGKRLGHSTLGTMSPDGLRAFDQDHNGTLLGEGAGFLLLESLESADRRGVRPYGYVVGAGSANEAAGAVAPDPSGASLRLAVERALRGGAEPNEVAVINAHGSGTPLNDMVEALTYSNLFGGAAARPVVFATKGAFGHTLGATGALEAIATLQALRRRQVPAVPGLARVMPQLSLPVAAAEPAAVGAGIGLSVTLGFGGFTTCLAFAGAQR